MHDLRWIRENPEAFDAGLKRRGLGPLSEQVLELDKQRRAAQTRLQEIQARRNTASKEIGAAKAKGGDAGALMDEVARLKDEMLKAEVIEREVGTLLDSLLATIPNTPSTHVPDGRDEAANVELRKIGEPRKFNFEPLEHDEIGDKLGMMDFERAAKISGARFVVLTGALARLERAIAAFMLDLHTGEYGYLETSPPLLVRDNAAFGTGQLPKFKDDLFSTRALNETKVKNLADIEQLALLRQVNDSVFRGMGQLDWQYIDASQPGWQIKTTEIMGKILDWLSKTINNEDFFERFWLIPTAEVPLTNLVAGEILEEKSLPLRFTAHTACFRSEAGAAGKDTRGMMRQHQFYKVELVSVVHPEQSEAEHERMTGAAEEVLKRLCLPYRVVMLCTGDMGFSARKTYDIEVWLPGQGRYREISSCSNCGDFQARRMNARFRPNEPGSPQPSPRHVHTLNGSGLAVGRTLIAVLENYQEEDGSVVIPEALRRYMGGVERISPP